MKYLCLLLFVTATAHASPLLTVKERLRLHLWEEGLETKMVKKKEHQSKRQQLPEELERALRKF